MRRTARLLLLSLVPMTLRAQGASAPGSVTSVVQRAGPAVVLIRSLDANGRSLGLGSGFVAPDGRVITNAHVVAGASAVEIVSADGQLLMTAQFAEALNARYDVAVLPKVNGTARLDLAKTPPPVGEHIVVIGAPEGLSNTVSDGIVSGMRALDGPTMLQVTAPISHGSSGGPVLNLQAQVVGIATFMLREGQNLNFAVPAADLQAMLNSPAGNYPFPDRKPAASSSTPKELPNLCPTPTTPGPTNLGGVDPCAAITRMMDAATAMSTDEVGKVWGTASSPARRTMSSREFTNRARLMLSCLSHDAFKVVSLTPLAEGPVVAVVELTRGVRVGATSFRLVRGGDATWYIENFDLLRLRDAGFCG